MIVSLLSKTTLRGIFILQLTVFLVASLLAQPGTQKWSFETDGNVLSSPAIGPDNVIYVGSQDRNLYAINPDGTEKWKFTAAQGILKPPAIADDGTIYAVDNNGTLCALNPDGSSKWIFPPAVISRPSEMAISEDGTIYYAVGSTYYAVNPDGSQFWTAANPSIGAISGISIGKDGVVLAAHGNGPVVALNPLTGAQLWRFDTDFGGSSVAPAVAEDGSIYFGTRFLGNNFYAVNPDGTLKWKVGLDAQIDSGPSTAVNGDIYVPINFKVNQGMDKGLVLALDSDDGSEKWRYETDGGVGPVPAVGFDGTIYFGTTAHKLIALRPTPHKFPDGSELWVLQVPLGFGVPQLNSSPTIAPDGTLYLGSTDDSLYAVFGGSPGLAASSWPKKQRDVRNTGRLGSDVTRRRWFAPHVYWLDEENNAVVIISNIGEKEENPAGTASSRIPAGIGATTASFRIDVLNRDGSVFFSMEDSVDPGETKEFVLAAPDNSLYAGAAIIDSAVKDGLFLAPFLTWNLDVSAQLEPLAIGAFFSDPTDAAQVHHFPAEASADNGLGIGVQNIGKNNISCLLEFFNADGSMAAQETINLGPEASVVDFFNDLVLAGDASLQGVETFKGRGAFTCDSPVVAVAVNQDFANGGFPTDRITIKGPN